MSLLPIETSADLRKQWNTKKNRDKNMNKGEDKHCKNKYRTEREKSSFSSTRTLMSPWTFSPLWDTESFQTVSSKRKLPKKKLVEEELLVCQELE